MTNLIPNATGLDLDGWAGADLLADDATVGAPGRVVVTGSATVSTPTFAIANGARVWVAAHHEPGSALTAVFGSGATAPVPLASAGAGPARRGLASTFAFSGGWVTAPVGAGTLRLRAPTSLMKPIATVARACLWQAGPHTNPDLDYPAWPTDLPMLQDEGLQLDPIPTRKGFTGDSGWEATRRTTRSRRYRMSGQLALTPEERDRLMEFFDAIDGPFWFTRPDTREACLAQFLADGEPVEAGQLPGKRRTQIKLQMRVV